MGSRRALLLPSHATNEGSRRLRLLLRRHPFTWIARKLRCDESSVRLWAHEKSKPGLQLRDVAQVELGIPSGAWDEPPSSSSTDVYNGREPEPATARRNARGGSS